MHRGSSRTACPPCINMLTLYIHAYMNLYMCIQYIYMHCGSSRTPFPPIFMYIHVYIIYTYIHEFMYVYIIYICIMGVAVQLVLLHSSVYVQAIYIYPYIVYIF